MPKLYIAEGGQESVFELFDDEVSIGRGAANEIQIVDSHASKHQAVIRRVGGRPKLVDLESKNGTRVNGAFVNQRWLEHGDTVTIGAAALRFDASEQGRGAPMVQFRGAPARVAAAPTYAPQPVAAAAYAPPAAYTPPPTAPAPSSRSSRRRDEDDDEDEPRHVAKRPGNSAAVGILAGAGVIGGIALLFLLLSRSGGTGKNVQVWQRAMNMTDKQAALNYLRTNGDPTDADSFVKVKELIDSLTKQVADSKLVEGEDEAAKYYKYEILTASIEQWKNGLSNADLAGRIVQWRAKYPDTMAVKEFDNSPYDPFPKLRALLQQNAGGVYNFEKAFADQMNSAGADAGIGHYGDAIHKWETFRDAQKTLLVPDEYRTAANRIQGVIGELNERAEKDFQEFLAQANALFQKGDKLAANLKLDQLIDRVGIRDIVRRANEAKSKFR